MLLPENNGSESHLQAPLYIATSSSSSSPLGDWAYDIHDIKSSSLSSSPASVASFQHPFSIDPLTPSSATNFAIPRGSKYLPNPYLTTSEADLDDIVLNAFGNGFDNLMSSDEQWLVASHRTANGRESHHRDDSLSSLSSIGPDSPFAAKASNPRIAVTESAAAVNQLGDLQTNDGPYYRLSKPVSQGLDGYYGNLLHQSYSHGSQSDIDSVYRPSSSNLRARNERGLLPAPDFSIGQRSHTGSVASSVVSSDSPATPSVGEPDVEDVRRRHVFINSTPKLDRTMTDVYGDELFNPDLSITTANEAPTSRVGHQPLNNDMFAQRVHAANSQYLSAGHSHVSGSTRDTYPFRHGSPLAPTAGHEFEMPNAPPRLGYAAPPQMRGGPRNGVEANMFQHAMPQSVQSGVPSTISPKDALMDFKSEPGQDFPLFPQQGPDYHGGYSYPQAHLSTSLIVTQQYPFAEQSASPVGGGAMTGQDVASASVGQDSAMGDCQDRNDVDDGTETGTYSCTYHGCTQRFGTPALLQKHKREGHRQPNSVTGNRKSVDGPASSSIVNSQAGPHRCDRINPSTGKPCNTVFSRPYDLTRHEDTIHNARKQKVRCEICTEEKTFSRADALTRHFRVCHPELPGPGKPRRRGAH